MESPDHAPVGHLALNVVDEELECGSVQHVVQVTYLV